jgi:hypothetical protein
VLVVLAVPIFVPDADEDEDPRPESFPSSKNRVSGIGLSPFVDPENEFLC